MFWTGLKQSLKDISGHKYDTIGDIDKLQDKPNTTQIHAQTQGKSQKSKTPCYTETQKQ